MLVLVFDSDCSMCNATIQYIARKNRKKNIYFCSQYSDVGQRILREKKVIELAANTIVLVDQEELHFRSEAVRKVMLEMTGWRNAGWLMKFVPLKIRDFAYKIIANNRKRLKFSKSNVCTVPDFTIKRQFID